MSGEVFVSDDKGAAVVMVAPAGGCEFCVCSTKEGVEVAPYGDERRSMFLDSEKVYNKEAIIELEVYKTKRDNSEKEVLF